MKEKSKQPESPKWLIKDKINEVMFASQFLLAHPMKSIGGHFITTEGMVQDESTIKKEIYEILKPHITFNLPKKVAILLEVLRMECSVEKFPLQIDRIHVANGTLYLNGKFEEEKQFCQNRLPVAYDPTAPAPDRFLDFIADLIYEEDLPTLQEYLGYCLIPCTKAQKMMIILGNGGEGKSRLGLIMERLLGSGVTMNSIQKIETNKFARADLEGRLVMVDDDMDMTGLPKTSVLKTLVTAETAVDLEKKGLQSYQGQLYARFLCFGNGALTSSSDQSFGFYRRQLVLQTKAPPAHRENDPFLVEKMVPELEGILLWCLEGLHRLIENHFQFSVSRKVKENAQTVQRSMNTVEAFLDSDGYISFVPESSVSSKELYASYLQFCSDNLFSPLSSRSFIKGVQNMALKYHLRYNNNVYLSSKLRVWGFTGITLHQEVLF